MRRIFGTLLVILGVAMLALGAGITARNLLQEEEAGDRAQTVLEQLMVQIPSEETQPDTPQVLPEILLPTVPESVSRAPMEEIRLEGKGYVGYLGIPALELELPVMGACTEENLETAPCRYFGTPEQKDFVIGGHRYRRHFRKLYTLGYGDAVIFTDVTGRQYRYQVAELEEVGPDQSEYVCSGDWDLTLFTCTPGGTSRLVVRCLKA